jgi:hypothetical protein
LFIIILEFLTISSGLQTVLSAETHLDEDRCLEEQPNFAKLGMLPVGTRIPTVSGSEGNKSFTKDI